MPDNSHVLTGAFNLKPEDAIKYFEQKGYKVSFDWHEMKREAHTRAFTVAGVTQLDVLVDIRKAVEKAQQTGQSLANFKKELQPILEKKGWWGKKIIERPDGSQKEVDLSAPWRLRTIYRTNMQTAYMAGRYKGMKDSARLLPYWQYVAVMDGRTRDAHRLLHGKILRHDDPFWRSYYPPNGWGCRCRVVALSRVEVEKKGIKVNDGDAMKNVIGPTVPDGWDYNPGETAWLPNKKDYPAWSRDRVEKIVDRAKTWNQSVNFLGSVNYEDREKVLDTLKKHENEMVKQKHEAAVVIMKTGEIYRVDGNKDRVYPDMVFGEELRGSSITHNHPINETDYVFSLDDLKLFEEFELGLLRQVDERFVSEVNRDKSDVEATSFDPRKSSDPLKYWDYIHSTRARKGGYGYKRTER